MSAPACLLVRILRDPATAAGLTQKDWDLLIRQARSANLLARLALRLRAGQVEIPGRPRIHLDSAAAIAEKNRRDVLWEVRWIEKALARLELPIILLKGAAYTVTGLPISHGRLYNDIDFMVPKERLDEVERALLLGGWVTTHHNAYDQRYYRKWMHELPPLRHITRLSVLDVHHNILPETAPLHPDPARLRAAAMPVPGRGRLYTLSPADMILHSATHLFHDGELENGLRDLVDLDGLLRHYARTDTFWTGLARRSLELELHRPLWYALHYSRELLGTPVPAAMPAELARAAPAAPLRAAMDALLRRGLLPGHKSCADAFTGLARWCLYVRSHHLRMPPHLLLPHLIRKAWRRRVRGEADH
ncbi:MAG TPA: hypothetical protein ENJ19_10640 [Gammaproteobacteria bacterium]|nr:hypothetical protein [Gammaproteobacteria bacterium]